MYKEETTNNSNERNHERRERHENDGREKSYDFNTDIILDVVGRQDSNERDLIFFAYLFRVFSVFRGHPLY